MVSLIDTITSIVKDERLSYPNVSSGKVVYNSKTNFIGKGKITLICTTASYALAEVKIVVDGCINTISMGTDRTVSGNIIECNGVTNITITFESSCEVSLINDNDEMKVNYIVQLAN